MASYMQGRVHVHMHVSERDCPEFQDEIPFKEGRM